MTVSNKTKKKIKGHLKTSAKGTVIGGSIGLLVGAPKAGATVGRIVAHRKDISKIINKIK